MENFSLKQCNIVVVNLQAINVETHPLTLWISREHAAILNATNSVFIACLRWSLMQDGRPNLRNQFVTVETLSDDALSRLGHAGANSNGSNALLYASNVFIWHYQLDLVDSHVTGFKIHVVSQPITLSCVTLCSRTEETYRWFEKMDWCTRLLVDVCHRPVLCRQGDVCMFPVGTSFASTPPDDGWTTVDREVSVMLDLTVLECQPVQQGVLGPETTVTIVRADSLIRNPPVGQMPSCDAGTLDIKDPEILDECLYSTLIAHPQVLELVTKISIQYFLGHKQSALLNKTLKLLRLAHKCVYTWKARFKIQILAKPPLSPSSKMASKFDVFHVVFATSNTLKKYGFADLSWAIVQLEFAKNKPELKIVPVPRVEAKRDSEIVYSNSQMATPRKRCVQVCAIENHWDDIDISSFGLLQDSVVYMTPLLWFNLNFQPSKLVQEEASLTMQKMTPGQYLKDGSVNSLAPLGPLFADEIHICLIYSSMQEKHENCDALLAQFFNIPRCFCQGDVFCLNANEEMDSELGKEILLHDGKHEDFIYFYVADIKRKGNVQSLGFLVDRLHTSLYQEAAMQFYVPTSMKHYFSLSSLHPIWHSPLPFGFTNQTAQLTQIIMPYLMSSQLWKTTFPSLCIYGSRACGKMLILKALSTQFNLHLHLVNCWELIGETNGATIAKLKSAIQKASLSTPCLLVLKNIHTLCRDTDGIVGESRVVIALREILTEFLSNSDKYPFIFVGTTTDLNLLSPELTSLFLHHFKFEVPTSNERMEIMRILTKDVNSGLQISLKDIVLKTSGFVLGDLCTLTSHAVSTAYQRISKLRDSELLQLSLEEERELCLSGIQLLPTDFDIALAELQAANSDAIGAPKIPNVKWEDIGGLEYAKEEILDTVQLPLLHPELLATGLRRSGVLLYGPPGTGKTLLAKAVATECSLNFLSVKGPELINMYVGQSEENVRNVFQKARAAAPCIIFFDELDSLAPNRGGSGDSGGVMDRVVSQLLAEIDGLHRSVDVFIMGATNRPDLLDSALLRPGRFDKLLYVRISSDRPSQLKIIKALTRKFMLGDDVNLSEFVEECPEQLTGADFYALCSDALLCAMSRNIQELDKGNEVGSDIVVLQKDFIDALQNLTPSVSEDELKRYSIMETTISR